MPDNRGVRFISREERYLTNPSPPVLIGVELLAGARKTTLLGYHFEAPGCGNISADESGGSFTHHALLNRDICLQSSRHGRADPGLGQIECLGANVTIRFEISPEFVCGIELTVDGVKLAWSIADYLASLDKKVVALLKEQSVPAPGVEPKMIPAVELAPATNVKAA